MRTTMFLIALLGSIRHHGQVIVLTYEASFESEAIALDSIRILNLTQDSDTLIYFPNNTLVLGTTTIANSTQVEPVGVAPNPFNGASDVFLNTRTANWTVSMFNSRGQLLAEFAGRGLGKHRLRYQGRSTGALFLCLEELGQRTTYSLIAVEERSYLKDEFLYIGKESSGEYKDSRNAWDWQQGDELRYLGYATAQGIILSASITEVPTGSATHSFNLAAGIVCAQSPTVTDADGNIYPTVQIGTQCWMAENLRTSRYSDNAIIPNVTGNFSWVLLTEGAWANYMNFTNSDSIYGKLYNWQAASNQNICPQGWHVPNDTEWTILNDFLGGNTVAGGKMKTTQYWTPPNAGATNSSGFAGLPAGNRDNNNGTFSGLGGNTYWWSTSENGLYSAWTRYLDYIYAGFGRVDYSKKRGHSIRCVRD